VLCALLMACGDALSRAREMPGVATDHERPGLILLLRGVSSPFRIDS
jgi:hypothetical protein